MSAKPALTPKLSSFTTRAGASWEIQAVHGLTTECIRLFDKHLQVLPEKLETGVWSSYGYVDRFLFVFAC